MCFQGALPLPLYHPPVLPEPALVARQAPLHVHEARASVTALYPTAARMSFPHPLYIDAATLQSKTDRILHNAADGGGALATSTHRSEVTDASVHSLQPNTTWTEALAADGDVGAGGSVFDARTSSAGSVEFGQRVDGDGLATGAFSRLVGVCTAVCVFPSVCMCMVRRTGWLYGWQAIFSIEPQWLIHLSACYSWDCLFLHFSILSSPMLHVTARSFHTTPCTPVTLHLNCTPVTAHLYHPLHPVHLLVVVDRAV